MEVVANSTNGAGAVALQICRAALRSVLPDAVIRRSCRLEGQTLFIQHLKLNLQEFDRVLIAGAGKASCGLAAELAILLGPWVAGGLVVTKEGHGQDLGSIKVFESAHPVPNLKSIDAGEAMAEFARSAGPRDLVLFMLSGGASSLLELPNPGVTLPAIQARTTELLRNGSSISEINAFRKSCSQLKGGGLADLFEPATVISLVLSDVLGDSFETIGSGPLYRDGGRVPHVLLANLQTLLDSAIEESSRLQFPTVASNDWIFEGEARVEAEAWTNSFLRAKSGPKVWIGGGEPVVQVIGSGLGGRCQEFATAGAGGLEGVPEVALLAASTDGTDGPTPYSGGLVTGASVSLARKNGFDVRQALAENASTSFLAACDGLIKTGPTQSNVNDLYVLVGT